MKKVFSILLLVIMILSVVNMVSASTPSKLVSLSLVNQEPNPASAGESLELRLGVENLGSSAIDNLQLEIIPEFPFELLPGESAKKSVGAMTAYQSGNNMKVIKYKLRIVNDVNEGVYGVRVVGTEGGTVRFDKFIDIDISSRDAVEIKNIDNFEVLPGKETEMKFVIHNIGSSPLRDLKFHWTNEEGVILPIGSDDTKYIKYIGIGEEAEVVYNVMSSLNVEPDLYKLQLTLSYDDPDSATDKIITTTSGIYVGGETDFDIAFSGSNQGETSFSIANVGSVEANSVTVSIPKQEGWRVSGSNSVIIGNLDKGDYTIASFTVQQSVRTASMSPDDKTKVQTPDEEKGYGPSMPVSSINVQIAYTDTRGQRKIITKEVELDASSLRAALTSADGTVSLPNGFPRKGTSSTWSVIWGVLKWLIVLGLLIGSVFGYRYYKQEKRKNPYYNLKLMYKDILAKFKKKK